MKSLEHLIREIREGKGEKGDKKSLAHTIRKMKESKRDDIDSDIMPKYGAFDKLNTESELSYMGSGTGGEPKMHAEDGKKKKTDESVGFIGTKDYQGNQFKSVRTQTPHIKPPVGPGSHSQAPENVSRQRTLAKERTSMTMHNKVNEEELLEYPKNPQEKLNTNFDFRKLMQTSEPDVSSFLDPFGGKIPGGAKIDPTAKTKIPQTRPTVPYPAAKPPTKEPAVSPNIRPPVKEPIVSPIPKEIPFGLPIPVPSYQPKTDKKTEEKPQVLSPTIEVGAEKKVAIEPKVTTTPKVDTGKKVDSAVDATETPKPKALIPFGLGSSAQKPHEYRGLQWTTHPIAGKARKHKSVREEIERKNIQNVPRPDSEDRRNIEIVGRKDSDPKTSKEKTSRQASYKINVIDENRKLAGIVLSTVKQKKEQMKTKTEDGINGQSSKTYQYPNGTKVLINPEMNRNILDIDGKMPNDYR